MNLPEEDVHLFYTLYHSLLFYTNEKYHILTVKNQDHFFRIPFEDKWELKEELYQHPELIDKFVAENPFNFSDDELKIITAWKDFKKGTFVLFKSLKKYTIFLDMEEPPRAYGVLALLSDFEDMVDPLPAMAEAVLLPFKEKIIYDGLLYWYSLTFGSEYCKSFNDTYQKAKFECGIITSLPFSKKRMPTKEEKLKFYMKNERNRDQYWEEIQELIEEDDNLLIIYHQEMGRACSRKTRKLLYHVGIEKGWFATIEGIPIASGVTREDAEKAAEQIVPEEKREFVYYFQLKKK
ncbi:MAG: hypothetical protein PVF58_06890 [Candidatus Methanofastidiosia archaeon]|jgi:hypothetical protein